MTDLKSFDQEPSFYQSATRYPYALQCMYKKIKGSVLFPDLSGGDRERFYHYVRATTLAESISTSLLPLGYALGPEDDRPALSCLYLRDLSFNLPINVCITAWLDTEGFRWDEWEGCKVPDLSYGLVKDYRKSVMGYATFIASYGPLFLPDATDYHIMQKACVPMANYLYTGLDKEIIKACEELATVKATEACQEVSNSVKSKAH